MTTETVTKPCVGCGAPVARELPPADHPFREKMASLDAHCDPCLAASEAERAAQDEQAAREEAADRTARRFKESGLPERHRVALEGLDHSAEVIAAASSWATDGGGLLLTGDIGRGKTTIAGAACWARLQHRPVIWASTPLLFARLGSGFATEQHSWAIEVLSARKGLVLDDIDKARPTEYGAEQVFLAIDQRVENETPLLVTTNLSPAGLAEKWPEPYGPAIASRLVGYCRVVRVSGVDRRLGLSSSNKGGSS